MLEVRVGIYMYVVRLEGHMHVRLSSIFQQGVCVSDDVFVEITFLPSFLPSLPPSPSPPLPGSPCLPSLQSWW